MARPALGAVVFLGANLVLLALPLALAWLRDEAAGPGLAATLGIIVVEAGHVIAGLLVDSASLNAVPVERRGSVGGA